MDTSKLEKFTDRILTDINSGMSCLNLYIGHRLGLFESMKKLGNHTPEQLSRETNTNLRYITEWLECMAAGEYIEHDPLANSYSIPPEHALALIEQDDPNYMAAFICWIPSLASVINPLIDAFRSGKGIPYEDYGQDGLEAIGHGNKPMFINDLVSKWIPAIPNMKENLEKGAKVADMGCGIGWSSISLAKGFQDVTVEGFDSDIASIDEARAHAEKEGVSGRVKFHALPVEKIPMNGKFDLITAFECIHDMAYPAEALAKMKDMLSDNGTVIISEEAVGDSLEENKNFFGHLMYNFSVLHCVPQSMAFPNSAAIGTVMKPSTMKKLSERAGFTSFEILPIENPFWRFYQLKH